MLPEGWNQRKLDDVAELIGGSTPSKAVSDYWDGEIPWATPSDITSLSASANYIYNTSSKITKLALEETSVRLLNPGSVLMTSRATIGEVVINMVPMATNQGFCNFIPNSSINAEYLTNWLKFSKKELKRLAAGSTFLEISKKTLKNIEIDLPPLSEQIKIAAILSSVDDAIQATQAVIEQSGRVKQGLLQQLLTRGIGHTRFKQTEIGEIPESWEIRTLPEVAKYQNGKSFPSKDYCSSGVLLARPGNLASDGFVIWDDQHTTYLPHHYWEECSAYRIGPKEILMNLTAQSLEDQFLGRVCITPDENQCLLNQRIARITPKTIDFDYLFWVLKGPHFRKHVDMIPKGSKVQHLYNRDLETAQLAIPSDIEEQIQIASMLWTVQDAANKNENQLSNFHLIKRGLMQDLLTGRVRVKLDGDVAT
jgi:type I restriction enzyme, S subunit